MATLWQPVTEFTDALQNPAVCFDDPTLADLAAGQPDLNPVTRRPIMFSGGFATVYPVMCGGKKYALRCFTRQVAEPERLIERYGHLSEFFERINSDAFVGYSYHDRGIRVKGEWFPTVRMDWVEGQKLHKYVGDNLGRPDRIRQLCDQLVKVTKDMQILSIAHNDLQHGNVMVQADGKIRLVDYDGFYLPRFQGQPSPEAGEINYQHPLRTNRDYGIFVDNFPALVIYLSLLALSVDSELWRHNEGDHLIFTKADYIDPANSDCFRALKASQDPSVRHLAEYLERCCSIPVEQIPNLEEILNGAPTPSAPAQPVQSTATPAAPPPSPSGNTTRVVGGGSEYLRLLQMRQGSPASSSPVPPAAPPPATPTPSSAPPATIACPRCHRQNRAEFQFCGGDGCLSPLYPMTRVCGQCGERLPENGKFCIMCGETLV